MHSKARFDLSGNLGFSMTGKTAVVTGGNGHVGSHLVENLLDHGYNVIATVRVKRKHHGF